MEITLLIPLNCLHFVLCALALGLEKPPPKLSKLFIHYLLMIIEFELSFLRTNFPP